MGCLLRTKIVCIMDFLKTKTKKTDFQKGSK